MHARKQFSILPYDGKTFVAFLDLSGFKKMVLKNRTNAGKSLGNFYNTIYSVGRDYHHTRNNNRLLEVDSIVVSDCAVIFPRIEKFANEQNQISNNILGLQSILTYIREVNRKLIGRNEYTNPLMTTCSIAFGDFKYENRIGLRQVEKNFFLGEAYIDAFIDSETKSPKLEPSQCRLLKKNLDFMSNIPDNPICSLLKKQSKYYYFYWMLQPLDDQRSYERKYREISQSIYPRIIKLIQDSLKTPRIA